MASDFWKIADNVQRRTSPSTVYAALAPVIDVFNRVPIRALHPVDPSAKVGHGVFYRTDDVLTPCYVYRDLSPFYWILSLRIIRR